MKNIRENIKMMSVNQISVYHTLLEAYNIMRYSSSEKIHTKWTDINEKKYFLRIITNNDLKVPWKPKLKCLGFTYNGAKLFNILPLQMRENKNPNSFKIMTKDWIWKKYPFILINFFIVVLNMCKNTLDKKSKYTILL